MKKIFAIMLVIVMCISMVACANTDKEIENNESSTTIEQVEDETVETTEAVENPDNTETTEPAENTEETTAPNENEDVTTSDDIDNDNSNNTNQGTVDNNDSNKEDNKENNKTEENKAEENKTENNKNDKKEDKTETEETKPTDDVAGATEDKNDTENTENTETTEPVEEENEDEIVTPTYTPNQLEQNIFNIINQHRANAGLPALTFEYSFYSAAKTRATEAATCFSHTRPNGSNYTSVFAETGIKWDFIAGENVGRYFADAETAMNAFMNSQVHKDNILYTGYTRVCIAVVESELYPGYYVIEQLFAGPAGAY